MADCSAVSFNNVPASVFDCLVEKAADQGITIDEDSGTASRAGFTIEWNYNRAGSALTIQCLDKPFWASCDMVNDRIRETVNDCGGS